MDIISKIEIKHFRSFDGGKDQQKVHIEDLQDINIFSGSNDSGKSNVLRALNLFFNNEITPGIIFDKERDFSKIAALRFDKDLEKRKSEENERIKKLNESGTNEKARDLRRSDEIISIKIFFNNKDRQRGLPDNFWISRSYSQKNDFHGDYTYQGDLNKAQTTAFLKSFRYEYVPAIKDKSFFLHLFTKLQNHLFEKGAKLKKNRFRGASNDFNSLLKSETIELFDNFLISSGVAANFHIPDTLVDFFRTLSVLTENDISLFDRGDGVQARFIPEILDEISKNSQKNIIWGFEEPENSYESRNIRKLRDEFLNKYSKVYQVFITTHTMELLSIKRQLTKQEQLIIDDKKIKSSNKKKEKLENLPITEKSSEVSIYRVWKKDNTSLITKFDESNNGWDKLCDDLGIIQESRIIESLQNKISEHISEVNKSGLELKQQKQILTELNEKYNECVGDLNEAKTKIDEFLKPILSVEDSYIEIYKIGYLKIKNIEFTRDTLEDIFDREAPFVIRRAGGAGKVRGFLEMNTLDGYEDKKVVGLFDYDREGSENFYQLKKSGKWSEIYGSKKIGYARKRSNHECFYALILPIPDHLSDVTSDITVGRFESFVEIENLINNVSLQKLNCVVEETVLDKKYFRIKEDKKSKAKTLYSNLPADDFKDFIPLYTRIFEFFKLM